MKRWLSFLLTFTMLFLTACSTAPKKVEERPETIEKDAVQNENAPKGDETPPQKVSVALYFTNPEKTKLITQMREVYVSKDQTKAQAAIQELLKGPGKDHPEMISTIPEGTVLRKFGQSENIATVNLSSDFKNAKDIDALIARICVVNTLTELEDTKYVSIFVEDQELGFNGKPYGPMTKFTGDIQSLWAEMQGKNKQDAEIKIDGEQQKKVVENKDLVLYFQDPMGQYLIPEVRNVEITGQKYITAIINELAKGPKDSTKIATLPKNLKLLQDPKLEEVNGKKVITLNLSRELNLFVQRSTAILALGSIVDSITDFIPDVDQVRIFIDGESIDKAAEHINAPEGRLSRKDFESLIGKRILLYYSNLEVTALIPVYRAIPKSELKYARVIVEELIKGPREQESGKARAVISQGITKDDILGISVEGDLVKLNFSKNFQDKSQGLGSAGEAMMIYSIVDSLTELPNIRRVQFFIEGKSAETLAGHISINQPLIRNPGIILKK